MNAQMQDFTIRTMRKDELAIAIDWAANEGWNPGLYDLDSFFKADPNGFLMAFIGDVPVACISVVKYGASFGFLGFYIVVPEYRGLGYGMRIWTGGLKYLAGRNIGLDGVADQQENYRISGFELAYRNIRYEGISNGDTAHCDHIVALADIDLADVIKYDKPFFEDDRREFLSSWLTQQESVALGYLSDGKLLGYGVLRPCRDGCKIGPLFADNDNIAKALFAALQSHVKQGVKFYLDVPKVNKAAVALAIDNNMQYIFETARMYKGNVAALPVDNIFGVTTFELG